MIDEVIKAKEAIALLSERLLEAEAEIALLEEKVYGEDLAKIRRNTIDKIERIDSVLNKLKLEML